jgi:very-short-patch-repair endonuclease
MHPRLAAVARNQAGVFTRAQAKMCGYTDDRIRTELINRRWIHIVRGVYRLAGSPGGWNTRVWSAILAAGEGAVLAGRPAGRLHRIDGVPAYDRLTIAVPKGRRPRRCTWADVVAVPFTRADTARRAGIPLLSGGRTTIDLARTESLETGIRIVGDALRSGLVTPDQLMRHLDAARGRDGITQARHAVALADPVLESVLEAELFDAINETGLVVVPQYQVFHQGLFVARLDFTIEELAMGFEADGYGVHSLRPAFERDRERNAMLQLAGWTNTSFTATQIRGRRAWVQQTVLRLEDARRSALGARRSALGARRSVPATRRSALGRVADGYRA